MPSKHYNALSARVAELSAHLLPTTFSPINVYSKAELDRARAYRVLAHAEIEYYLEQIVLEIAEAAFHRWKNAVRPSIPLVSFLSNMTGDGKGLPQKLGTSESVTTIAGKVLAQYRHIVNKNNGIRTENILKLFLPIGLLEVEIDPVWISTIDGFGAIRGAAAHSTAVSYSINPQDDHTSVASILSGLVPLDARLLQLKRSIR